jgi:prepilin-type N-terminal cleavage/methylation domain-containing protein
MMRRSHNGFTLIELLIALAITAILTGSIVACLSGGIRIWERSRIYGRDEVDLNFATELLAQDLANLVPWEGLPLEGNADRCAFPVLLRATSTSPLEPHWVRYQVLRGSPTELFREVATLDSPDLPLRREPLLAVRGELAFRYAARPHQGGDGLAGESEWRNPTNAPLFVFIAMRGADDPVWRTVRELRVPLGARAAAKEAP